MNTSPIEESPDPAPDVKVKRMAPVAPIKTPVARLQVIASFKITKERRTTSMGLIVMMIPVLTGDVKLSP